MKSALVICSLTALTSWSAEWQQLPSLPDREGFAGSFAGVANGALLVGGGANFPNKKPWQGGEKVWYDTVFMLNSPSSEWKAVGKLPRPLGYGVSVTHRDGMVCAGGGDRDRHYAEAFRLEWKDGQLITTKLPPLPMATANCSGALVGDWLYVAGGLEQPAAARAVDKSWRIDLAADDPRWEAIAPCPGGARMLAVAAGRDGVFYLLGGAAVTAREDGKATRRYLADAYRYDSASGWRRLADLPRPIVAAPSPAPIDDDSIYVLGGDDGSQADVSPDAHRGFATTILCYKFAKDRWLTAGAMPAPRVTVPCVKWRDSWIIPGGEMRPGIRSIDVWAWTATKAE